MRASTTVTLLCLAASVAPSVAVPSIKSEREINPRLLLKSTVDAASVPSVHNVAPGDTGAVVSEEPEPNKLVRTLFKNAISSIANAGVSTVLFALYSEFTPRNSRAVSLREQLEHLDKRIKQERAAYVSKRELLSTTLDNLDR